jgi:hypothetical protein
LDLHIQKFLIIYIYTYIYIFGYGNGYSSKFNKVHPSGCGDVIVPRCDRREGNFYAIVKLMLAWTCQAGSSPELLLDMTFWKWCRDERIVENDENGIS